MIRDPWRHGGDRQTRRGNPSNLSIWHLFLLSFTPHTNFNHAACIYTLPLALSLSLSHCHFTMCENNAHIAKCGSNELHTKGYGDHFSNEEGSCWHKGRSSWVFSTTMTVDWPSKSLEPRTRCRANDVPCTDRLTWLVMTSMRLAPVGLSEAEMCVGHCKECTNLLFIKCGVTWDWRLNGDLRVIQLLHRRSHTVLLLVLV